MSNVNVEVLCETELNQSERRKLDEHSADGTPVEERHRVKIPACRPVRHYLEGRVDGRERRSSTERTLGNITAWSMPQELWKAQFMTCAVMRAPTPPQNDRETANSVDSRRDGELSN